VLARGAAADDDDVVVVHGLGGTGGRGDTSSSRWQPRTPSSHPTYRVTAGPPRPLATTPSERTPQRNGIYSSSSDIHGRTVAGHNLGGGIVMQFRVPVSGPHRLARPDQQRWARPRTHAPAPCRCPARRRRHRGAGKAAGRSHSLGGPRVVAARTGRQTRRPSAGRGSTPAARSGAAARLPTIRD
jgi:hypothetical protein